MKKVNVNDSGDPPEVSPKEALSRRNAMKRIALGLGVAGVGLLSGILSGCASGNRYGGGYGSYGGYDSTSYGSSSYSSWSYDNRKYGGYAYYHSYNSYGSSYGSSYSSYRR